MFHTKKYTFFSGLTTILRSEAGGQSDRFGHDDDDDDLQRNYHNNAHWLHPSKLAQPSNFVAYYDATSLYPSSGELTKEKGRGGGGKEKGNPHPPVNHSPPPPLPLPSPLLLPLGRLPPSSLSRICEKNVMCFFSSSSEMQELPYGTGSLYVTDPANPHLLKRENRSLNATERAEAVAVQYLALGVHERFIRLPASQHKPVRIFSSIHTGPGQQVFGYTEKQRADLTLVFDLSESSSTEKRIELHYFNYHGYHWHYEGHMDACPSTESRYESMKIVPQSQLMDNFRYAYAEAMSQVFPGHVTFHYHVVYECELVHGIPVDSILEPRSGKCYYNAQELLAAEMSEDFYLPPPRQQLFFNKENLVSEIAKGQIDGFVTLRGGREARLEPTVSQHFGFCVQNFAPQPDQVSEYTKEQIARYYNLPGEEQVDNFLLKQPPRTLNSTTFHSEETVSTNYLRWLMKERQFCDFEITHFLWYKFGHHSRKFIEPLLQLRHEMKKEGNLPAAEVLKLILNGAYGYVKNCFLCLYSVIYIHFVVSDV